MIIIQGKLISADVVEEQFMCNLKACKGACCWEGDYGAPLETTELEILDDIYPQIKKYLSPKGIAVLEKAGRYTYYKDANEYGTPLIDHGACAYMTYDEAGVAQCGIEQAYNDGVVSFKKPISCHLYPIRVTKEGESGFEALNYDRWDICSAACSLGAKEKMPVYKFTKDALIRKYGAEFYAELEAASNHLNY